MNELEAKQQKIWQSVARNWRDDAEEVETWFAPITQEIVRALGNDGGTLADLGCGAGSIRYPHSWKAVGLDIAEDMVKAHGCASLGSFDPLPFKSESFDAIVSRFGFIFAANVLSAFHEAHRALKSGGRIVFSVWADPNKNPSLSIPTRTGIEMLGLDQPKPTDPSAFRLADQNEVRDLLQRAGFANPEVTDVEVPHHRTLSKDDAFARVLALAGPVTMLHARMDPETRNAFEARVRAEFEAADLTGEASIWSAHKP